MRSINFKAAAAVPVLAVALLAGVTDSNAQVRNKAARQEQKIMKQQQKVAKQHLKVEQERLRLERQRLQAQQARAGRYRLNRGGSYYNIDQRQADLLRQAVNAGYQQGYQAGRSDRSYRRQSSWLGNSVYRSGVYGYQSYVGRDLYQYYFQQGFQRGYQDGYNSQFRYGSNSGGSLNILGTILQQVLNLQQY